VSAETPDPAQARTASIRKEAIPDLAEDSSTHRGHGFSHGMKDWCKLGLSVVAAGDGLMASHAMLPSSLLLSDRIRVYFSACDADLRGRVFYADLERTFPFRVIHICQDPILDVGLAGAFDADGVNPSQIIERDGNIFMYYIGWQRISSSVPYTLLGGLAISTDDGASFQRVQDTAILAPTEEESYFRTAPFVWYEEDQWQMLYIGGGEFFTGSTGKRLPRYALRHTHSRDGWNWTGPSRILLEPNRLVGEIGFGRPVVTKKAESVAELMLSVRSVNGYTLRSGPFSLERAIDPNDLCDVLPLSQEGWDSEMTCFGVTVELEGGELLIYNGNQFGRSGFGLAWRRTAVRPQGEL
jgi:hypothetical protein